jgi:hypothetical protein
MATPWIGAIVVLGALALITLAGRLDRKEGSALYRQTGPGTASALL